MRGFTKEIYFTSKREYAILCQQCRVDWLSEGILIKIVSKFYLLDEKKKINKKKSSKSKL